MTVSTSMIQRVKQMTGESSSGTYDATIATVIAEYPLVDSLGNAPIELDWTATYCLNSAAADIWEIKAAAVAQDYDFTADGASYKRSQVYEQYMKQARRFRARRAPKTFKAVMWPKMVAEDTPWIGNVAEDDD